MGVNGGSPTLRGLLLTLALSIAWARPAAAQAQAQAGTFEPEVGQAGKDVVWVPTSEALVEKMLDLARITRQDLVVDLGSGDGRNVIAAAKRGARGRGVEFNPDMVALSRRNAELAGVADRVTFVEGDMFEADFSDATALALFLLPGNLDRLRDKFLALKPGTRIVANTFWIDGWDPDQEATVGDGECTEWCRAMLFIVPAQVAGTWKLAQGELTITQSYQKFSGTLAESDRVTPVAGSLVGDRVAFSAGGVEYTGRVNGSVMEGTAPPNRRWTATRIR
jgi:SAM-dependent methyltransferase